MADIVYTTPIGLVCLYAYQSARSLENGGAHPRDRLAVADNKFAKIDAFYHDLRNRRADLPRRFMILARRLMSGARGAIAMGPEDLAGLAGEIDQFRKDIELPPRW